jgi:hypothetical protein
MILTQRRRMITGLLVAVLIAITAASVVYSQWLDPGDKGDMSTGLVADYRRDSARVLGAGEERVILLRCAGSSSMACSQFRKGDHAGASRGQLR